MTADAEVFDVELGHPGGLEPTWSPDLGAGWLATSYEETPELLFPWSAGVYDRMRRTDSQIQTLLRAIFLGFWGADWHLDDAGVEPEVANFVRTELGLPKPDEALARVPGRGIVLTEHHRMSVLELVFGFMPFEPVYDIAPPRDDQPGLGLPEVAHLSKLGPRLPRTITEVRVNRDGSLAGIVQAAAGIDTAAGPTNVRYINGPASVGAQSGDAWRQVFIPAHRLMHYVNDREGADWTGTSILRTAYKHWLIKDQLLRIDAQSTERNGMGLPVVKYNENHSKDEALAIARAARAGATAGVALPEGMSLELLGVTGSIKDPLPSIEYHDRAMTRSGLAMFLDLGHDRGAQNLGETFLDFFTMAQNAYADGHKVNVTEGVIRPLVVANFGQGVAYPRLACSPMSSESTPTAVSLKLLTDSGILRPDDDLEAEVRRRHGLPPMPHYAVGHVRDVPVDDDPHAGHDHPDDGEGEGQPPADDKKPADPAAAREHRPLRHGSPDDMLSRAEQLVNRIAELRRQPEPERV